jgi:pimeloyl-ACP methyl ester carboxylesterase
MLVKSLQYFILGVSGLFILNGCVGRTANIDNPDSVAELTTVEIGGMDQWILIRGNDISSPVLLWLHGGPGASQMPIHHAFTRDLEEEYIVVHWDQRGAGKSNHRGFSEETMTFDRFVEDTHELTQYLKERFNRQRIFLLGHSWGSQLGIQTVKRFPADYHAFISVGQVVHAQRANQLSYDWLQDQVQADGSRRQKRSFERLGTPPFTEHDRYVSFAKMKEQFGGGMDAGMGRLAWTALRSKEYTIGDYIKWLRGANRGSGPMWEETQNFNMFEEVPTLELPVWFIIGSNDYNTPARLVEEYHESLEAPEKHLVVMDGTAHTPFIGDPARFNREVIRAGMEVLNSVE